MPPHRQGPRARTQTATQLHIGKCQRRPNIQTSSSENTATPPSACLANYTRSSDVLERECRHTASVLEREHKRQRACTSENATATITRLLILQNAEDHLKESTSTAGIGWVETKAACIHMATDAICFVMWLLLLQHLPQPLHHSCPILAAIG